MTSWLASPEVLPKVKAALAVVACVALYLEARRPRAVPRHTKRWVGLGMAAVAIAAYFQFGPLPGPGRYHAWEMYHYYVGAKHAGELGYTRLYACAAVAESELGFRDAVEVRTLRNLDDDSLMGGRTALEHSGDCHARFSPERWQVFRSDISWFRATAGPKLWARMQNDHGFNPSPVWTVVGHGLASLAPPSHLWLGVLALIDVVLMIGLFAALGWAFGWRVMSVAAVFLGTQAAAEMPWTGGAFLRMDWLLLCVLALALMRKRYFFWAGFAVTYAALLRVFPLLLWTGPLVVGARQLLRSKRLSKPVLRLLAGGAVAAAVLVPPTLLVSGPEAWPAFARHTTMHAATPITNHMSLRTLFSAAPNTRLEAHARTRAHPREATWTEARRTELDRNLLQYWAAAGLIAAAFVIVVARLRTLWLASGLGVVLIVALTDPSCYYYSFFLLAVPLSRARRSLEMAIIGLAGVSQMVIYRYVWLDDRFWWLASAYVAIAVLLLTVFARPPRLSHLRHHLRGVISREAM